METSRARDRAELVTDDRNALKERLEAVTGERIAALEAVDPERVKDREAGVEAGGIPGGERDASAWQERDKSAESDLERARSAKSVDREFGL